MCNKYGGEMRMAFDKMDWHAVTFPDSIPYENAGTHIGMYLAWLVNNDLIQDDWREEFADAFERVRSREMTGRDLLVECLDEALPEELMVDEALEFTGEYYVTSYIDDFEPALGRRGCRFRICRLPPRGHMGKLRQDRTRYQRKV